MSTIDPAAPGAPPPEERLVTLPITHPLATGIAIMAGVVMAIVGVLAALAGISALLNDDVYIPVSGYVYALDLTTWGWIHLVLGILIAAAGVAVLSGRLWARVIGIILASLNLIANFLFVPYSPWWSVLLIALDVVVIWALVVDHHRDGVGG